MILLVVLMPLFASENFNFWQELFTDPIERIYIIMKDGTPFKYTNYRENVIYMSIELLEKRLKTPERTYKIKDIAIVIHNHRRDKNFSPDDIKQYRALKRWGFSGLFLMYCHRTNKTYTLER